MRKRLVIEVPLKGDPQYETPKQAGTHVFVPSHVHDHGALTGLLDDDHPQYLTEDRGATLFLDLLGEYTEKTTGENLGLGVGIFVRKSGDKLQFKSFVAGDGVRIVDVGDYIVIESIARPIEFVDWQLTFEESEGW